MSSVTETFGSMVFSDSVMRERMPRQTYRELQACVRHGGRLTPEVASVVANVMKDWAIEKGATHFTHWFQPLTGITAEKHDGFLSPTGDGSVIMFWLCVRPRERAASVCPMSTSRMPPRMTSAR